MAAGARRAGLGAAGTALLAAGLALALSPSEVGSPGEQRGHVRVLSAANWSLVLQGQWMVQFYAPWCPACQQIEAAWENFAKGSEHLDITVGKVDVTQEPDEGSVWVFCSSALCSGHPIEVFTYSNNKESGVLIYLCHGRLLLD